jgi:hypothetical protein
VVSFLASSGLFFQYHFHGELVWCDIANDECGLEVL